MRHLSASPTAKKPAVANGWLPGAALTAVAPMPLPKPPDWIGTWCLQGCSVEIKRGDGDRLRVDGQMVVPTANDFHNGGFSAHVAPQKDTLAFTDDGSNCGEECEVRMQRISPWLLVVDNAGCGGAGVSVTGHNRRKN